MMGHLKRPYRKIFEPVGWDKYDPQPWAGSRPIRPGSVVKVTGHAGPFRWIEDEHDNRMSVGKESLRPVPRRSPAA